MKAYATIEWDLPDNGIDNPIKQAVNYLQQSLPKTVTFHSVKVKRPKNTQHLIVLGVFSPDEVLPHLGPLTKEYEAGNQKYSVRMNSARYYVFRDNIKCVCCGVEGKWFFLEKHRKDHRPHFNLYADVGGTPVLMTKDHIKAKSKGGINDAKNYQTMCATCNNLKRDDDVGLEELKKLREFYDQNRKIPRKQLAKMLDEQRALLVSSQNTAVV